MTLLALSKADLEDIEDRAAAFGVEMEVDLDAEGNIWLGQITRRDGVAGSGRRALDMLCELADEAQIEIGLVVISWLDAVVALYQECGFEIADHDGRHVDDDYVLMRRQPA